MQYDLAARDREVRAVCKENTWLKQTVQSVRSEVGSSRDSVDAAHAELARLKDAYR